MLLVDNDNKGWGFWRWSWRHRSGRVSVGIGIISSELLFNASQFLEMQIILFIYPYPFGDDS